MAYQQNSSLLLFLSLNLLQLFHTAIARGGERHSGFVDNSYAAASRRHLSEENHVQKLDNLAHGYMTNSDLEKAVKAFHGRCGHISRIYRAFNHLPVLGKVSLEYHCGRWKFLTVLGRKRLNLLSSLLEMCMEMNLLGVNCSYF